MNGSPIDNLTANKQVTKPLQVLRLCSYELVIKLILFFIQTVYLYLNKLRMAVKAMAINMLSYIHENNNVNYIHVKFVLHM